MASTFSLMQEEGDAAHRLYYACVCVEGNVRVPLRPIPFFSYFATVLPPQGAGQMHPAQTVAQQVEGEHGQADGNGGNAQLMGIQLENAWRAFLRQHAPRRTGAPGTPRPI